MYYVEQQKLWLRTSSLLWQDQTWYSSRTCELSEKPPWIETNSQWFLKFMPLIATWKCLRLCQKVFQLLQLSQRPYQTLSSCHNRMLRSRKGTYSMIQGTLINMLLDKNPELFELSISYTTRRPRQGEVHGR